MSTEVKIPSLGESISSGIIAAWHVKDGDYVEKDQVIYELETDKITSEGTAEVAGEISLKASEGDEVEIGEVVATIDESASAPSDSESKEEDSKKEKKDKDEGEDKDKAEDKDKDASKNGKDSKSKKDEDDSKEDEDSKKEKEGDSSKKEDKSSSDKLSPAVRRLASDSGIDPDEVSGSGKGGRVTKGDMLEAIENRKSESKSKEESKPEPESKKSSSSSDRVTRKRMSPLRKKIAHRLVTAQQEAAMLTTFNEVDLSAVKALRSKYQDSFVKKHGIKLGFMSFFVKAVIRALQEVPGLNAQIDGDEIVQNHFYDIGIAVSTDKGLLVPVVRDCDKLTLAEIEKEIVSYAGKARDGKIKMEDLQGGVFTITNGGVFGSLLSTPILNAPQSGILGMHTIQDRPVAIEGKVEIRPMMYLAVSYDHRIVDGREAVTFLIKVKESIEDPARLIIDV